MPTETSPGSDFLQEKYHMQSAPEVESAARRRERQTGEKVPDEPASRIQNYLNRFEEIIDRENPEERERGLQALKTVLYRSFIIKPEEIPESYYQNIIKRQAEEGRPIEEIPEDVRAELAQTLVDDQKKSLDLWVDYLSSDDAKYPDWLKYWAFRNLLVMGRYDKEKKKFTERSKSGKSVSPYPDLNRQALSFVFDAMEKKQAKESITFPYDIQDDERAEFLKNLDRTNFSKLYAWSIEKINPIGDEALKVTQGEWRSYPKGSDPIELAASLANYGTGWCIRGESTARRYLSESSLEIFYSLDENGGQKFPE